MITEAKLAEHFYPVVNLGDGLIRCADELAKKTIYTYFKISEPGAATALLVSDDVADDDFAAMVLTKVGHRSFESLHKEAFDPNPHGFTHLLLAPHQYHSNLKGRLDDERPMTTLCVPIFDAEFSGSESPEQFYDIQRHCVPTQQWQRDIHPQISLRFDNPKTGSGTMGDGYVFTTFGYLLVEVDNLIGSEGAFIEILNHKAGVVELLPAEGDAVVWIEGRDDAGARNLPRKEVEQRLWSFLTQPSE